MVFTSSSASNRTKKNNDVFRASRSPAEAFDTNRIGVMVYVLPALFSRATGVVPVDQLWFAEFMTDR